MLKTEIIGHLGQDAIVRHWNGKKAISFSIAYNESYRDKDGTRHDKTTWVNCTLWREGDTKLASYLRKGQLVFAEGTPVVKTYVSKESGEVKPDFQLNVRQLQLLGKNSNNEEESEGSTQEPELSPSEQAAFAD
jgi:single-strand DNA-binding protein